MKKPRLVVLESPYAGDVNKNVAYARKAMLHALELGEAPFAGHLLYTQVWDDKDPAQRAAGIAAHCAWIDACEWVVAYCDLGISKGMQAAMDYAEKIGKPVVRRAIGV